MRPTSRPLPQPPLQPPVLERAVGSGRPPPWPLHPTGSAAKSQKEGERQSEYPEVFHDAGGILQGGRTMSSSSLQSSSRP